MALLQTQHVVVRYTLVGPPAPKMGCRGLRDNRNGTGALDVKGPFQVREGEKRFRKSRDVQTDSHDPHKAQEGCTKGRKDEPGNG